MGIDPLLTAGESREQGIRIFPIGIGSLSGSVLYYTDSYGTRQYFSDEHGGRLRSNLDEPMMRQLADMTRGQYFHADDRIGLDKTFSDITASLQDTKQTREEIRKNDLTPVFLILFLILFFLERSYLRWIMRRYRLIED